MTFKLVHRLKKNVGLLRRSLDAKHFLLSYGLDVLAILLVVGFAFAFLLPLQKVSTELGTIDEQIQQEILNSEPNADLLGQYQNSMMSLLTKLIGFVVAFVLLSLFAIVATRLYLWRRITGIKAPSELLRRRIRRYVQLFVFSLVLLVLFLSGSYVLITSNITSVAQLNAIAASPSKMIAFKIFLEFLIPLVVIIGMNFNYVYAKTSKIFYSVKQAFVLLFQFFNYYIIPYIFIRIVFIARWPFYFLFNRFVTGPWLNFSLKLAVVLLLVASGRLFLSKLIVVLYKRLTIVTSK